MMTKGVLVSLFEYELENNKTIIFSSPQFNGDMKYDQCCGEIAMKKLYGIKNIKTYKKIMMDFAKKYFNYVDISDFLQNQIIPYNGILTDCGKTLDNPYVIDKNVLVHELKYSDYAYIVNCLNSPFYYTDMNNEKHLLVPKAKEVAVLHYGCYIGSMIDIEKNGFIKFILAKDEK